MSAQSNGDDQLKPASTSPAKAMPTKTYVVVGSVDIIQPVDKNCQGTGCWWEIVGAHGAGASDGWVVYASPKPNLQVGKAACVKAQFPLQGDAGPFLSNEAAAAHYPRLVSYRTVGPHATWGVYEASGPKDSCAPPSSERPTAAPPPPKLIPKVEATTTPSEYLNSVTKVFGNKFTTTNGREAEILGKLRDITSQSQLVDEVNMYVTLSGRDETSTAAALAKLRSHYIGKYLALGPNWYKIAADRDYPLQGKTAFAVFGNVHLVGDTYIPVNVVCHSALPVPPYSTSFIFGIIKDFRAGENKGNEKIIVPVMEVMVVSADMHDGTNQLILNHF